mmetsp:Transcript_51111/g.141565  ORF Transcript_51111/g.141565 Transcript_51111/m.141565 type:complete len:165 (-) Transcript_51111:192-686(-)
MVALGWRLAGMAPLLLAGMASAKKKMGGSLKCEKGIFTSEAKDAAIALCDEHFPDEKAKNDWIVMFYEKQSAEDVHEGLNRIAQDLGNEPPEKSKSLIKTKKQRSRSSSRRRGQLAPTLFSRWGPCVAIAARPQSSVRVGAASSSSRRASRSRLPPRWASQVTS